MVLASGIPEVRRFCYSITAHAQELQAIIFLSSKLSSLLNSAALRVNKKTALPEAKLDHTLHSIVDSVESEVGDICEIRLHVLTMWRHSMLCLDAKAVSWMRFVREFLHLLVSLAMAFLEL